MKSLKRTFKWLGKTSQQAAKKCDITPHEITFTIDDQTDYTTAMGGLCAMVIGIFIAVLFFISFVEVMNKETVIHESKIVVDTQSTSVNIPFKKGMMFAIGVQQLDFRYEKIFNFRFSRTRKYLKPRNQTQIRRTDQIKLVPCTQKVWDDLGLLQFYDSYAIRQMLCPDPNEIMRLSDQRGYRLEIEKCSPEGTWPANFSSYLDQLDNYFDGFQNNPEWTQYYQQEFGDNTPPGQEQFNYDEYYPQQQQDGNGTQYIDDSQYYDMNQSISVGSDSAIPPSYDTVPCLFDYYQKVFKLPRQYRIQFYYVNSIITPQQKQYVKKYVDYQQFLIQLTNDTILRTETELYINSYDITTNNNIWFDAEYKVEKKRGLIKTAPMTTSVFIYSNQTDISTMNTTSTTWEKMDNFFTLDFRRGSDVVQVDRKYKNVLGIIDQLGGYLSFFGAVLAVLLLRYNQLCFQLNLVKGLYFYDKSQQIPTQNLNYITFLIYQVYLLLGFFGCAPKWKFCEQWQRACQRANKILDIKSVVQKVQHLQKVGMAVLDEQKYYALYLQQPQNLQEEQDKQKATQIYQKLRDKNLKQEQVKSQQANVQKLESSASNFNGNLLNDQIIEQDKTRQIYIRDKSLSNGSDNKIVDETYLSNKILNNQQDEASDQEPIDQIMVQRLRNYVSKIQKQAQSSQIASRVYKKIDPTMIQILFQTSDGIVKKRRESIEVEQIHNDRQLMNIGEKKEEEKIQNKQVKQGVISSRRESSVRQISIKQIKRDELSSLRTGSRKQMKHEQNLKKEVKQQSPKQYQQQKKKQQNKANGEKQKKEQIYQIEDI